MITTQPQPQPAAPPQPTTTPQPQLQSTIPTLSQTTVALETQIPVLDAKIDTVNQPTSTEKSENNRPTPAAADIPTAVPLKMPESTESISPAHSVNLQDNEEVSRMTPKIVSTLNKISEKPPTSKPAAESLYTRETVRLLTSDLAAILIVLISMGTFLGTSFGISPLYYVLLLSAASLICFQFFSAE
jgi:hypothetical protein